MYFVYSERVCRRGPARGRRARRGPRAGLTRVKQRKTTVHIIVQTTTHSHSTHTQHTRTWATTREFRQSGEPLSITPTALQSQRDASSRLGNSTQSPLSDGISNSPPFWETRRRSAPARCRPAGLAVAAACSSAACGLRAHGSSKAPFSKRSVWCVAGRVAGRAWRAWRAARGGAPMATKSSLTFVAVFALVSMKKMPLSLE